MYSGKIPTFNWFNPTRVVFGVGELARLAELVNEISGNNSRIFLVTGRSSLKSQGILDDVISSIGPSRITLFNKVSPFPSPDLVDDALSECRQSSSDIVVAIGGGSALDLAKCVAILMTHEGGARDYAFGPKNIQRASLPFIAVPTTSGSSSEVTIGAALWDMEAQKSAGLFSPHMFPTVAIVDPNLTMSMPQLLAANTGFDAFTSAFESYWSVQAEPISDAIALEVIRIFCENLERSCIDGDITSRSACALAATLSGIGYSNSLPNMCHAVGSPLTIYWNVEHGQSVGITLPSFLRWNSDAISDKMNALLDAMGVANLDQAESKLSSMLENCGLETRLSGLGLVRNDIETLTENIKWELASRLPRSFDKNDARSLLEEIF